MDETQNWPEIVAEKERKIAELELQNQWLLEQLKLSKQRQYGTSSEKNLDGGEQLSIFNEAEATADPTAAEPALEQIIPEHKRRKQKGKREADFSGLPVEQVVHELSEAERVCPDCGGLLHACGHEVYRREVTVVPPQFKVTEHVQTAYSCRKCEEAAEDDAYVFVAAMPHAATPTRKRSCRKPRRIGRWRT